MNERCKFANIAAGHALFATDCVMSALSVCLFEQSRVALFQTDYQAGGGSSFITYPSLVSRHRRPVW